MYYIILKRVNEDIDIYDTMSVNVKYSKGAVLSYSLNAHSPYEGWKMTINGSKGRVEAALTDAQSSGNVDVIKVIDMTNKAVMVEVPVDASAHGGGDVRLRHDIFVGDRPDPLGHRAGSQAGINSIMIGIAANVSIKEKRMVCINDLLRDRGELG